VRGSSVFPDDRQAIFRKVLPHKGSRKRTPVQPSTKYSVPVRSISLLQPSDRAGTKPAPVKRSSFTDLGGFLKGSLSEVSSQRPKYPPVSHLAQPKDMQNTLHPSLPGIATLSGLAHRFFLAHPEPASLVPLRPSPWRSHARFLSTQARRRFLEVLAMMMYPAHSMQRPLFVQQSPSRPRTWEGQSTLVPSTPYRVVLPSTTSPRTSEMALSGYLISSTCPPSSDPCYSTGNSIPSLIQLQTLSLVR
jgi:hypothetical protein